MTIILTHKIASVMSFIMGPPVDPREILYHASTGQYLLSIILGFIFLFFAYRLREKELLATLLFSCGFVFLITTPWIGSMTDSVIGAYPTIDKQGSLLFYLDGVHQRALSSPIASLEDPAHRLIGFHLGHFWVVEFFDLFLSSFTAYNAQMLLNLVLNLWIGSLFLRKMGASRQNSVLFAVVLGLQLHVFRDLHWYTIEKSSLFWLFGFWIAMQELCKVNAKLPFWTLGLIYLFATWMNFYWGIILGILGGHYSLKILILSLRNGVQEHQKFWKAIALCILFGLGIAWIQLQLSAPHQSFASPTQFKERAILDSFSLYPLNWNRMGTWQAINPLVIGLCIYALKTKKISVFEGCTALLFFLLSLGPEIIGIQNPLYTLLSVVPGLWRLAKPEIFFLISYTLLIVWAARVELSTKMKRITGILLLSTWFIGLHSSTAYPYLSEYIPAQLPVNWEQRFFPSP